MEEGFWRYGDKEENTWFFPEAFIPIKTSASEALVEWRVVVDCVFMELRSVAGMIMTPTLEEFEKNRREKGRATCPSQSIVHRNPQD